MAEPTLAEHLFEERSRAVRLLLGTPLLDVGADPDGFRLVARHQGSLIAWFETTCGWDLTVDAAAGFARLAKRSARPDASRPLTRTRGASLPFDARRYQLLCLTCAELVRHPVTTVGLLASAVAPEAGLETSRHGDRSALVDALRALVGWGALRASGGEIDAFLDNDAGNALLSADTARLHRLLTSATAPSALDATMSTDSATDALSAEPRYGDAPHDPGGAEEEQRLRWLRHSLARRLLDDPVVHLDDLGNAERDYLASPAGRRWLRDRVGEAGLELEERAEGLLALDADALATDKVFPAPLGNAHQVALLLVDALVTTGPDGQRRPAELSRSEIEGEVTAVLSRFVGWARARREGDGPQRLADEAVELLVGFGLARRDPDGAVAARPALCRYRSGEPIVTDLGPTLFEEVP